jgi:1-phosphofructokinase
MIYTLTLNPTLDIHMQFDNPKLGTLNRAKKVRYAPSGKGLNVSSALFAQGIQSTAILPLGGPMGYLLEFMLQKLDFEIIVIPVQGETRANTKVIDQYGVLSEFNGAGAALSENEIHACFDHLNKLGANDVLILSGSLPPGVPSTLYAEMTTQAQAKGARVYLDASGEALIHGLGSKPNLVKPNQLEAEELFGKPIRTYHDALQAAKDIQKMGVNTVILSLEERGAIFLNTSKYQTEQVFLAIPPKVTATTPSGAGDAMLAGVIYGLEQNWSWGATAKHATATATARVVSTEGFPNLAQVAAQFDKVSVLTEAEMPQPSLRDRL